VVHFLKVNYYSHLHSPRVVETKSSILFAVHFSIGHLATKFDNYFLSVDLDGKKEMETRSKFMIVSGCWRGDCASERHRRYQVK